ncbi:hypothetical protein RRG08_037551 [Elysia crispata]|uniref:G-protein coupled receptors family 1 profile domain-containing protein n=1 Tax=Elysia crispata TaxID=231223 RepID=A0AAE1CTS0_9GAST|nr:hypothetical protein RRG08_037551 [Elysia crispata]
MPRALFWFHHCLDHVAHGTSIYLEHYRLGLELATVFLSSACSFTSVWLIVFVSHENFVRIARAYQVKTVCTRRRALVNIALLHIIAVVIYNCHLWTSRVLLDAEGRDSMCMALSRYRRLLVSVSVLDLVATLVLPVLAVLTIMAVTIVTVVRAVQRHRRLNQGLAGDNSRRPDERGASKSHPDGQYKPVLNKLSNKKTDKRRAAPGPHRMLEMKVARFLTIVTLTLIVLSSPSHALRLKMVITSYMTGSEDEGGERNSREGGTPQLSVLDATLQRAFEVVYYLSFSGNLFIFLAAGRNFRRIFVQQMRAHALCVCLFFQPYCCEDDIQNEVDAPQGSQDEAPCERSVQSSGSRSLKLSRNQSFGQRCKTWLKVEDAWEERGGFGGSDRDLSRGGFTSLELLASSCIEMENIGLDLGTSDREAKPEDARGTGGSGGGDTTEGAGSESLKDSEIREIEGLGMKKTHV